MQLTIILILFFRRFSEDLFSRQNLTVSRKRMFSVQLVSTIFFCFDLILFGIGYEKTIENRLIENIFKNHSIDARPVRKASDPVVVKFGIELVQLIDINERRQYITTKLWVRQFWQSDLMKWDPKKWGGVNQLNIQANDIWKPDIVLYNNAEETSSGSAEKFKTLITLYPSGMNSWLAPATFSSTCKINVKNFPFDSQTCKMKFGSWAFDATKLNLTQHDAPFLTAQYVNSSTWDIVTIDAKFNSIIYRCCANPFLDITFTFVFKRRPLYYVFNVIAPCIVLVSMVLFSFLLPAESGERLSLNITVMLALAVFLQFLSGSLPRNSDSTPILSVFFITLMTESAAALVTTILVLAIHHKGEENGADPPPAWTRKFFLHSNLNDILFNKNSAIRVTNGLLSPSEIQQYKPDLGKHYIYKSTGLLEKIEDVQKYPTKKEDVIVYSLQDILREIIKISQSLREQDQQEEIRQEWKSLGKAIDRTLFLIFLTVFIASAIGTLLEVYSHVDMW